MPYYKSKIKYKTFIKLREFLRVAGMPLAFSITLISMAIIIGLLSSQYMWAR